MRTLTAPNSTPAATSMGIMLGSATRLVTKWGGLFFCTRCKAAALSADMPAQGMQALALASSRCYQDQHCSYYGTSGGPPLMRGRGRIR